MYGGGLGAVPFSPSGVCLAFDGEEGCTAVSHATVVGEKSRNAGHHGLQRHGPSGQVQAALEGCARREVLSNKFVTRCYPIAPFVARKTQLLLLLQPSSYQCRH